MFILYFLFSSVFLRTEQIAGFNFNLLFPQTTFISSTIFFLYIESIAKEINKTAFIFACATLFVCGCFFFILIHVKFCDNYGNFQLNTILCSETL